MMISASCMLAENVLEQVGFLYIRFMSLESILLLVILGVVLTMFFLIEILQVLIPLVQLNEALRNEIQEIRRMAQNAQSSRIEIEGNSNHQSGISEFQKSTKQNMQLQFSQSNKIVKEVTRIRENCLQRTGAEFCDTNEIARKMVQSNNEFWVRFNSRIYWPTSCLLNCRRLTEW